MATRKTKKQSTAIETPSDEIGHIAFSSKAKSIRHNAIGLKPIVDKFDGDGMDMLHNKTTNISTDNVNAHDTTINSEADFYEFEVMMAMCCGICKY